MRAMKQFLQTYWFEIMLALICGIVIAITAGIQKGIFI